MQKNSIFNIFVFIIITGIAITIYSNSLYCDFQFDDEVTIVNNSKLHDLAQCTDLAEWKNINSRPLSLLTFALNYHYDGLSVFGYHVVNLAIHIITALLIYLLVNLILSTAYFKNNRIFDYRKYIALFVALIFVVHPIQTMAVTYIVQRMAALSTMFYILSVLFYLKGRLMHVRDGIHFRAIIFYLFALLAGVSGVLSKQNAITFPLVMLLVELFFVRNKDNRPYKAYLLVSVSLISLVFLIIAFSNILPPHALKITKTDYLFTQLRVIIKYIQLLFAPISQNIDYDFAISRSLWGIKEVLSLLLNIVIIAVGVLLFNKKRLLSFGIFWFFLTLSVESSIIPINDVIMEYRLNLPMFGFSLFLVGIFWLVFSRWKMTYFHIAMTIIIIGLSILTYERNKVWKTSLSLWTDTVAKSPDKARPYNNLGYACWLNKDYDNALKHYSEAIHLDPNYVEALNNLGLIHFQNNNYEYATVYYEKVLSLDPGHVYALNNLGLIYQKEKKYGKALNYYKKALARKHDFIEALYNCGNVLQEQGDLDKAIDFYNKTLDVNPNYTDVLYNLGNIMYLQKKYDQAIEYYTKTIQADPEFADAINNLGNMWYLKGNKEKAKELYKQTLSVAPNHKQAQENLNLLKTD